MSVEWGTGIELGWRARLSFSVAERLVPSTDNFSPNMTSVSHVIGASNKTINLVSALEDPATDNSLLLHLSFTPSAFSFLPLCLSPLICLS